MKKKLIKKKWIDTAFITDQAKFIKLDKLVLYKKLKKTEDQPQTLNQGYNISPIWPIKVTLQKVKQITW